MPDADQGTPYSRIYATLARDHPRVWFDPPVLGWYVRLLLPADRAWPGLAELPRTVPDDVVDVLVADEVIDRVGDALYRFHGLDQERNGRRSRGYQGGVVRSSSAPRDAGGRFVSDAGLSSVDAGPDAGDDAGSDAGYTTLDIQRTSETNRKEVPVRTPDRVLTGTDGVTESSRARAREGPDETAIECDDYQGHRSSHRWVPGVGWRCLACERVRAESGLTFSERVVRADQGSTW